ncbi:ketopantoate reductase PanE/ApbA C terminal-domain-containing protein [Colletotrichum godetiae]|uniref:2-dehydropantoate 2-reductase n=1 Tax=Colletotrichum godetiae TaxID=1209918 RepID=A0AAJ0EUQ4_9PEZI|nr:ketopantoate reductase PanE/ApbA C terminal-domain-containing protein [Colletotrichum godetiae]KAK1672490.1 ketopantoate reductase PanE/ApbA C terminal-domain-containing protein [Colletotrichum godetiae]
MAPDKARVLLVGCGGIGTIAALNLEAGGLARVTAVLRSNFDIVNRNGFTIHSCEHGDKEGWRPTEVATSSVVNTVPASANSGSDCSFDYVVCCTKNVPDAGPSLPDIIAPAVTPGQTVIVLIQNGINIERPFLRRFKKNIVLSGVSRIDAHEHSPGVIEQKQPDLLHIGPFFNAYREWPEHEEAAKSFVRIYSAGGKTTCLYKEDVGLDRWSKLVYNASFNPICALTRVNASQLQTSSGSMDSLVIPAMKEVIKVAAAMGHDIPPIAITQAMQMNPIDENIKPSMQVDFDKGNMIEHENILGEVCRVAYQRGVATPILEVLYQLCCARQFSVKRDHGLA